MREYADIVTELSGVADLVSILGLVSTEAHARDADTPCRDVMASAVYAVEAHIRRISNELEEYEAAIIRGE